ncbi:uncharacterized protein LOC130823377 [Amaranthus tricolor]|uniref:uncharacterized protein LOC130823377 n=1 Tax=Amaranthus tricolor TaxID=29722 RepID=UPI0025831D0B|nr:uncharacterized protein LOC130823377 [Amaranthus tricolor]
MGNKDKVSWVNTLWNRVVIPKSRFVVWLAFHERLKTKQRLKSMGVVDDTVCIICGTQFETTDHLFFMCDFSYQCVEALKRWVRVTWSIKNMNDIYRTRRMPKTKLKLIEAIFGNLVYTIWNVRNEAVWQKKVTTFRRVVESIKTNSKLSNAKRVHFNLVEKPVICGLLCLGDLVAFLILLGWVDLDIDQP